MNYGILLGNEEYATQIEFWHKNDTESRSLIVMLAIMEGEIEYDDVPQIHKVFFQKEGQVNWTEVPPLPPEKYGVHQTHCCVIHGCKYGDPECPVEMKKILQEYPCESCTAGDEHKLFGRGDGIERDHTHYD